MECSINGCVSEARVGKSHAGGGCRTELALASSYIAGLGKTTLDWGLDYAWGFGSVAAGGPPVWGRDESEPSESLAKTWRGETKTRLKRRAALARLQRSVKVWRQSRGSTPKCVCKVLYNDQALVLATAFPLDAEELPLSILARPINTVMLDMLMGGLPSWVR